MSATNEQGPSHPCGTDGSTSREDFQPSRHRGSRISRRILAALVVMAVMMVGVYAAFTSTHSFSFPSATAPIVTKTFSTSFKANVSPSSNETGCGEPAGTNCFTVSGTTPATMTASSAWPASSGCVTATCFGVTLSLIYVTPATVTCLAKQPASVTAPGVGIPLPGQAPASITLNGATDYNYCIYYTSTTTVGAGSFTVTFHE